MNPKSRCFHADVCRLSSQCAHGQQKTCLPQPPQNETQFQSQRGTCFYFRPLKEKRG